MSRQFDVKSSTMTICFDSAISRVFPDAGDNHWRSTPRAAWTSAQKDWLTRGGSLTRHLGSLGRVQLRVVDERVDQAWPDEIASLGLRPRTPVWVREIVLQVDQVPFVAAHSVVPLPASRGVWQAIRALGTRPLAELLYADPSVTRSALVSRRLTARHPLHRFAASWCAAPQHSLLARRSVFERAHAPLLVTECMLPALWDALACTQLDSVAKHA